MLISIWEYTINKEDHRSKPRAEAATRIMPRRSPRATSEAKSKEPFTGQANSTTINTPTQIYKANGTSYGNASLGGYTYQASAVSQIYTAINTPTIHYSIGSENQGCWHASNPDSWTRANYPTQSTAKSIFDPCPYGYRVPTLNDNNKGNSDFFGFTTPPNGNGVSWLGSWWPSSGLRYGNSATLGSIGYYGYYWSASPYPSSYPYLAYSLYFYSGNVYPVYAGNRSGGFSVRCVQE